jgi:hypothetical protein
MFNFRTSLGSSNRLLLGSFYCRIAPCQLHINQKERSEEQLMVFSYAWHQKEEERQYHAVEAKDVRSFLFNY